ncbi:CinA family protein [Sphingopyxis panaciterrae]
MPAQRDIDRHMHRLAAALAGSELRWAIAESCTGGQLAALMAREAALGSHLERGFVVYSIDAKCEMLGVDRADAERCEAVNPEAAEAMAAGALANGKADFAIAVTGFCGPREKNEEVGLVHLACATREGRRFAQEYHFGDLGRSAVLDHAVAAALAMMTEAVVAHGAPVLHSA